jgi:ketosteroid isomerase-like protein
MSQEEKNEALVREFFEVLSDGDLETLKPLFHPDATWFVRVKDIPGAGTHKGRDYICGEFLAPVRSAFVDGEPRTTIEYLVAQGDWVAVQSRAVGARRSDGKVYDNQYAWFIKIKDDTIFEVHELMDSLYTSKWWEE